MSTHTPDFGEPLLLFNSCTVMTSKGTWFADTAEPEIADRIIACVSSLAGISDPAAAIQAAREALQAIDPGADYTDENQHPGKVACEISWADVRAVRKALALLTPNR